MGLSLSAPITNQHIHRDNTDLYRSAAIHLQGWRTSQEDGASMIVVNPEKSIMLFGVYDGHGGHLASQFLEEAAPQMFAQITSLEPDAEDDITELILQLDEDFLKTPHDDGSTACFVFVQAWDNEKNAPFVPTKPLTADDAKNVSFKVLAANVGDSRALIIYPHKNSTTEDIFTQCTEDHKPGDPMERMRIVNAGGHVMNDRVDGNLALSRAIGDRIYKCDPDLSPDRQKVIAVPDYTSFTLNYGDVLFVACDGIFEAMPMDHARVSSYIHNEIRSLQRTILDEVQSIPELVTQLTVDDTAPILDISKYDQLPAVVKKYIDAVWDPSLVSRLLIQSSLAAGSKDNHTAMTVSFAPLLKDSTADTPVDKFFLSKMEALAALPHHYICPGFLPSGENAPVNAFTTDLLRNEVSITVPTEEQREQIALITNVVQTNQLSAVRTPIDWSEYSSILPFPPIALTRDQMLG